MLPRRAWTEEGQQGDCQKPRVTVQAGGGEGVNHGSRGGVKKKSQLFKTLRQNKKESIRDEDPVLSLVL